MNRKPTDPAKGQSSSSAVSGGQTKVLDNNFTNRTAHVALCITPKFQYALVPQVYAMQAASSRSDALHCILYLSSNSTNRRILERHDSIARVEPLVASTYICLLYSVPGPRDHVSSHMYIKGNLLRELCMSPTIDRLWRVCFVDRFCTATMLMLVS